MTATPPRPRSVEAAFWLSVTGAVLLIVGGMMGMTRSFGTFRAAYAPSITDAEVQQVLTIHRGIGLLFVLAGATLGYFVGRTRRGDTRIRRAQVGLSIGITVLMFLMAIFARFGLELLSLIAVLPIAVSATLLVRPQASAWFEELADKQREGGDG